MMGDKQYNNEFESVCECFHEEDALMIASALNRVRNGCPDALPCERLTNMARAHASAEARIRELESALDDIVEGAWPDRETAFREMRRIAREAQGMAEASDATKESKGAT
jgi:hypothetical protein